MAKPKKIRLIRNSETMDERHLAAETMDERHLAAETMDERHPAAEKKIACQGKGRRVGPQRLEAAHP